MDPVLECDANGHRQLNFMICHCGDAASAAKDVAAIRKFGKVARDTVAEKPWVVVQSEHDGESPHGWGYYMSGGRITKLIPAMLDHAVESIKLPGRRARQDQPHPARRSECAPPRRIDGLRVARCQPQFRGARVVGGSEAGRRAHRLAEADLEGLRALFGRAVREPQCRRKPTSRRAPPTATTSSDWSR